MSKSFLGQVYLFIASALGYLIGGGFMSGQESSQFFVPFGYEAFLVGLIFSIIIIITNLGFIYAGKYGNCTKGTEVFNFFCGKKIGKLIEWFQLIFCFTMFVSEIAAGGSVLFAQYGLPIVIGATITAIITALTVSIGLNSVMKSLGIIMPFLAAFVIVVAVATLSMNWDNIPANVAAIEAQQYDLLKVAPNAIISGTSLVGMMVLFLASFSADLGSKFPMKPLMIGQSIGLVLYAGLDTLSAFSITSDIGGVYGKQIINLVLAQNLWAPIGMAFGVLIFFAIYTICTPMVYVIGTNFAEEGTKKHKIIVWAVSAIALVGAVIFPFDVIINSVYIASGYVGSFIVIMMLIKFIRIYFQKKSSVNET